MRLLLLAGFLLVAAANVSAQSGAGSEGPAAAPAAPKPQIADTKSKSAAPKRGDDSAEYLEQCLRDWDAATHMTRQEWARTCRRVVENRTKFMREHMK